MVEPALKILGNCQPLRGSGRAAARIGNQLGAPSLRLTLGALERKPAALALTGSIARVDDDGPATGRAFAKMPPHDLPPAFLLSSPTSWDAILRSTVLFASSPINWITLSRASLGK